MTFVLVFLAGCALFTLGILVGYAMATMDDEDMTPEKREEIRRHIRDWRGY